MQDNDTRPSSDAILDADGKLSSASAATSLKYARARDLPSYPSSGGMQLSSAGAAASLAASKGKPVEIWKPEPIPAANRAAMLAKDHKMDPMWKPEATAAGSKAAAAAHAHPIEVEPLQPKRSATTKSTAPSAAYDTPENSHRKAMMAATTASHNRRRSGSAPMQPVAKQGDDASWALKAATKSHKDGAAVSGPFTTGDPGFEAARIQNVAKNNVNRQLYTSSPPVSIEVQEKNRQDTLRASAVAMAQKMYAIQQKHIDEAAAAGKTDGQALAASRARSSTLPPSSDSVSEDYTAVGGGYEKIEEAARRLAQERLAKIHDEHAEYRSYYGQTSPNRSKLSMRLRRRASSAADDDSDEEQSRRIKSQMSMFQSKLAEVDNKKRQQDRDALLQIAHRNVDARMRKMDDEVFQETGKASPAQTEKWEKAAREKAQRDSDERMQYMGKVHIGGGKYLEQSELDAIAKARLQPTLDDIAEKAEKQRARDEEERLERERAKEQAERDKARAAETAAQVKADLARQKQEDKAKKDEEKRVQKEEQAAEKAKRDDEKRVQKEEQAFEKLKRDEEKRKEKEEAAAEKERARLEKEEKRKSKESKPGRMSGLLGRSGAGVGAAAGAATGATAANLSEGNATSPDNTRTSTEPAREGGTYHDQVTGTVTPVVTNLEEPTTTRIADTLVDPSSTQKSVDERKSLEQRSSTDQEGEPTSPSSPTTTRVKSWMKVRFGGNKGEAQKEGETMKSETAKEKEKEKSTEDDDQVPRTDSMRDVAMAGRTTTTETQDLYGAGLDISPAPATYKAAGHEESRARSPSISSLSSSYSEDNTVPKHKNFSLGTTEPPEPESDPRGRTGLKQRLLNKIKPHKDKPKEEDTVAPQATEPATEPADEEFEEARDKFEEETLAPPPPIPAIAGESSGAKPRSPRGSRERSRFTEDL